MSTRALTNIAVFAMVGNLIMLLLALVLGFSIEGTSRAAAESEKGQAVGFAAGVGLVVTVLGLALRRRAPRALPVAAVVGLVGALVAIGLYVWWDIPTT